MFRDVFLMHAHNPISETDVTAAYRLLLGREPENSLVIEHHMTAGSIAELHERILGSDEYKKKTLDRLSSDYQSTYDSSDIETSATSSQINSIVSRAEYFWRAIGENEPYWSVLTADVFKMNNINDERVEAFYHSGRTELTDIKRALSRNSIGSKNWTVLDLGCGLGRMCENFLNEFPNYIGIDISQSHLSIAKERAKQKHLSSRAEFKTLLEYLNQPKGFDLFFSVIALQHNSPPMMCWLLDRFLSYVRPGGAAFFQIPCYLDGYTFKTQEYIDSPKSLTDIEMHALPQERVISTLTSNGFRLLEVLPYPRIGPIGYSFSFLARKEIFSLAR